MDTDFVPGADPEEIKEFLHGLGLIPLDEYYVQLRRMIKRQSQSPKTINEQVQKKLMENGIHKDDVSKNMTLLCPRKRTSFSPVITRKRGKAIKKRTPSASQLTTPITTVIKSELTILADLAESSTQDSTQTVDYDQPLDLRLQSKSVDHA